MAGFNPLGLLKRKASAAPAVPEGTVVFAVGDVHGCADLMAALVARILEEAGQASASRTAAVFLGDYVDRGPGSREVIEALIELKQESGLDARFIRGNHDQAVLDFLNEPKTWQQWSDFGGRETLASYGVVPPQGRPEEEAVLELRAAFERALPGSHLHFLRSLESAVEIGDYFFTHAGARPGVALAEQSEQDLMWIRQPFLADRRAFAKVVVHGHTPAEEAHVDHRRIGLDTGAYATGMLSAMRFEGTQRTLIQARRGPGKRCEVTSGPV